MSKSYNKHTAHFTKYPGFMDWTCSTCVTINYLDFMVNDFIHAFTNVSLPILVLLELEIARSAVKKLANWSFPDVRLHIT